jgi:hypothetical protein
MNKILGFAVIIVVIIVLLNISGSGAERFANPAGDAGTSFVRLYEGFKLTNQVFDKSAQSNENLFERILMPVNLKSLDIQVALKDSTRSRGVAIWSVYPGMQTASTQATGIYMDAYDDPTYAFRANTPKYHHVVTVMPGEHKIVELDEPVKRIFMIINI